MHLVVREDGEVELPFGRLHVSSLQQEDEGVVEGRGGGVASRRRQRRLVTPQVAVPVAQSLLDGDSALHHISEGEGPEDL